MTDTLTRPDTVPQGTDLDDDLAHLVCVCDLNTALCGTDVSTSEYVEETGAGEDHCVVCVELAELLCPWCGE